MDILDEPLPGHMESISAFRTLLKSPSDRVTCPDSVARPAEPDALQTSAIESWKATEPSRESRLRLLRLLNDLTYIINSKYKGYEEGGLKRYWVDVFGSVSWAGDTGHSGDLDLIVLDRKLLHGYAPVFWRTPPGEPLSTPTSHKRNNIPTPLKHLPEVYDTFSMAECLRQAGFEDVESIAAASTPINKFKYRDQECDLNVNDLGGWYNSSLLLHYCRLAPYVLRPMVHALKLWASSHKLNDPSGAKGPATMSSYCLTLMAIAYLQHIGHLPNLQADINVPEVCRPEDTSEHDVVWVSWGKEQGVKAHVGFSLSPSDDWKPSNPNLTAADAIRGFFEFFSLNGSAPLRGEKFDRVTQIVSILQGGIVPRAKEYGQEIRESQQRRDTLLNLGISLERIRQSEDMIRQERFKEEERMGKGDRGIQPRNWGEKKLVVQDPFLWFKNCAGMMSRDGLDRWWTVSKKENTKMCVTEVAQTVDNTHRVIKLKGKNFTLADLLML